MHYDELIVDCAKTVKENDKVYGQPTDTMNRAAVLASAMLRKPVQGYDVAMILVAMKLARISGQLDHIDSYKDAMNYLGFAAQLATTKPSADFDTERLPSILRPRPPAPGPNGAPPQQ